ncbi:hypothetical protein E4U43_004742 [Claviceps pusilla]|uniref:Uncharacterized protein n=1 Tax=Claviceps pusilla TaxID=123648 RepID=A0A9P7NFA7_9HYPO|nr:hypothetical protein E4U43_004742 [Claviceps pusilla]
MDSTTRIISNLIDVVGCNGLRSLADLGHMRLVTIQGRVSTVEKKLTIPSIISIFIAWLQAKAMQVGLDALPLEEWCRHLSYAYGCTEFEILWYWDSSEWAVWNHLSSSANGLADVRRRVEVVGRALREVFARDGDASVFVSVTRDSRRLGQTSCDASLRRSSDDSRSGPPGGVLRDDHHGGSLHGQTQTPTPTSKPKATGLTWGSADLGPGDGWDISSGRLADKTDCDARSASSAKRSSSAQKSKSNTKSRNRRGNNPGRAISRGPADGESPRIYTPPGHYICKICGTWGTHYVWDCIEQTSPRHHTTVNIVKPPSVARMKDDGGMQETRETRKPKENDHCSVATAKSNLVVRPQNRFPKKDIQGDASPPKPNRKVGLVLRPSSAPREDLAPNRLNSDGLVESSLSLGTTHIKSPLPEMCARETIRMSSQVEDKRDECQVSAKAVAKDLEKLSAADEVALQCADEFLGRLERALKRKYQDEIRDDLMFWDDRLYRKRPRIEAGNDHDGSGVAGHVPLFDADDDTDVDAASIPCPASAARTGTPSDVHSGLSVVCNRTPNTPHAPDMLPGVSCVPTVSEPRHSAMELWQAGIEFKAEETSENDA